MSLLRSLKAGNKNPNTGAATIRSRMRSRTVRCRAGLARENRKIQQRIFEGQKPAVAKLTYFYLNCGRVQLQEKRLYLSRTI